MVEQVEAMAAAQPALAAAPENLRPAAYMHYRLGELGQQYAQKRSKDRATQ